MISLSYFLLVLIPHPPLYFHLKIQLYPVLQSQLLSHFTSCPTDMSPSPCPNSYTVSILILPNLPISPPSHTIPIVVSIPSYPALTSHLHLIFPPCLALSPRTASPHLNTGPSHPIFCNILSRQVPSRLIPPLFHHLITLSTCLICQILNRMVTTSIFSWNLCTRNIK